MGRVHLACSLFWHSKVVSVGSDGCQLFSNCDEGRALYFCIACHCHSIRVQEYVGRTDGLITWGQLNCLGHSEVMSCVLYQLFRNIPKLCGGVSRLGFHITRMNKLTRGIRQLIQEWCDVSCCSHFGLEHVSLPEMWALGWQNSRVCRLVHWMAHCRINLSCGLVDGRMASVHSTNIFTEWRN